MRRFSRLFAVLVVPVLAVTITAVGCGDKKEERKASADKKADGGGGSGDQPAPAGDWEPVKGTGVGVLKGKVTLDGEPPAREDLSARMKEQGDKDHCLKEDPNNDTKNPQWIVAPDKGVQNVVVWVRPQKRKYFELTDEQKKRADTVTIDQPFCMFQPHVVVHYPSYFYGKQKKQVATGQQFKVLNSAPILHNTRWKGSPALNDGRNENIQPKGEMVISAKPCGPTRSGEDLLNINCDRHSWMSGYAWVFDNPFHAVTKADGTYEIKGIPAGADVEVVYWHESMGRTPKVEQKKLNDGDNEFSPKLKK
jgi:hypothetical protein